MKGIVTIATGPPKYKKWAAALGRSLRRHYPHGNYHLITDTPGDEASRFFTSVSKLDDGMTGLAAKLRLDQYSPFDETLFIDADSLIMRSLDFAFEKFSGCSFSLLGGIVTDGEWYGDIATLLKRIDCEWLPKFNSGLIYFRKDDEARRVFSLAREAAEQYHELGLSDPYGRIADEPCFAIAMARCGLKPMSDDGSIMRTPIGSVGPLKCDPLAGRCRMNSEGQLVDPAIIHFVSLTRHRSYTACRLKLHLADMGIKPDSFVHCLSTFLAFSWAVGRKSGFIK